MGFFEGGVGVGSEGKKVIFYVMSCLVLAFCVFFDTIVP